jgi:hypothetical protein
VPSRNWKLTHKRFVADFQQIARNLLSADRIWPIADDYSFAKRLCGAHAVGHRVGEGIDAAAYTLEIDNDHVNVAQHLFGRFARFAVQRINRNVRVSIDGVGRLDHVVLNVAANSVLRSEERSEIDLRMIEEEIGGVMEAVIDGSLVTDESHARAVEDVAALVEQALQAKFDSMSAVRHLSV